MAASAFPLAQSLVAVVMQPQGEAQQADQTGGQPTQQPRFHGRVR
jgi:hypothetical protein